MFAKLCLFLLTNVVQGFYMPAFSHSMFPSKRRATIVIQTKKRIDPVWAKGIILATKVA